MPPLRFAASPLRGSESCRVVTARSPWAAVAVGSIFLVERVLLLNATFEPLALLSERRAVVLLVSGRVESIVSRPGARVFRSAKLEVEVPAIVRLVHMVHVPRWAKTPPLTRRAVLRRDFGRCVYCSDVADTVDHVVPRSRGGRHEWTNVVASCRRDNFIKGDHLVSELGWSLPFKPHAPDGHLWRLRHLADVDPLWEPFLATAS